MSKLTKKLSEEAKSLVYKLNGQEYSDQLNPYLDSDLGSMFKSRYEAELEEFIRLEYEMRVLQQEHLKKMADY